MRGDAGERLGPGRAQLKGTLKMTDQRFLLWLHSRLQHKHGEDPRIDFMHRLRAIIASTSADQDTPNDGRGKQSEGALMKKLNLPMVPHCVLGVRLNFGTGRPPLRKEKA